VLLEYVEKLIELGVTDEKLREFVRSVGVLGEAAAFLRSRRIARSRSVNHSHFSPPCADRAWCENG